MRKEHKAKIKEKDLAVAMKTRKLLQIYYFISRNYKFVGFLFIPCT